MADTVGIAEAAAALEDHFGNRLEVERDEGRRLMAEALQARFGIARPAARKLVEALEAAHSVRWIKVAFRAVPEINLASGTGRGADSEAAGAVVRGAGGDQGYWQL